MYNLCPTFLNHSGSMLDLPVIQIKQFFKVGAVCLIVALDAETFGGFPADGTRAEFINMHLSDRGRFRIERESTPPFGCVIL